MPKPPVDSQLGVPSARTHILSQHIFRKINNRLEGLGGVGGWNKCRVGKFIYYTQRELLRPL